MYSELSAILASVNSLATLLKAAQGLANYHEFVTAVTEINTKLYHFQTSALASAEKQQVQADRIRDLEEEIARLETWKTEVQRYELAELAPNVFAYRVKEIMRGTEPLHWICSKCFQDRKKGYLNFAADTHYHRLMRCVSCEAEYRIHKR